MSASMLGVSFSSPENRFDDLFQLNRGTNRHCWPLVTSQSRMEEFDPFSFGRMWQPYPEDVFSLHQQKQSSFSFSPMIEDEETRHGFLPHIRGSGYTPTQTVPTINDTIQQGNISSAFNQVPVMSLGGVSRFNAHESSSSFQKFQVGYHNDVRGVETSSSSLNPYGAYGCYSDHPVATHNASMEHTPVNTMTTESGIMESEQPTDLSMSKNTPQNLDSASIAGDNAFENSDSSRGTDSGRSESPIQRLTYTHLSDVSNDSEVEYDQNMKNRKKFSRGSAKKRFEKVVPYQLALPWISTRPIIERPNINMFDPLASYAQMVMGRSVRPAIASYICWLLESRFFGKITDLSYEVQKEKQKEKIIEIGDDSFYEHNGTTHSAPSVSDEHVQPAAEEYEVIDLTLDDDDEDNDDGIRSEQLNAQPSPVYPRSDQQLLNQEPRVERTIQQNKHTLVSPHPQPNTTPLQGPVCPMSTLTLSTSHLESSTLYVDSIMSPEKDSTVRQFLSQPFSSQHASAQKNHYFPPPMPEDHYVSPRVQYTRRDFSDASSSDSIPVPTCEKRPYEEQGPEYEADQCSRPKQLRRSPRLQSMSKESTSASVKKNIQLQNHQDLHKQKPADQAAQFTRRSPVLENEANKCGSITEKRSSQPWNRKGLLRFVAQNASNLPRHAWIERKEGEPRRSMRLAKKMQCRRYFLRPRLHTKS